MDSLAKSKGSWCIWLPLACEHYEVRRLLKGYLKESHVGAIIAAAFVVFRVVDKGTVFLWDAITCGNEG